MTVSSDSSVSNGVSRMDPELKAKWVAALRSGKYKQTREVLRRADGFCCLGVLCDVIDPSQWTRSGADYVYRNHRVMLPAVVSELARLTGNAEQKPMEMNDDGKSFAAIADWIEANL